MADTKISALPAATTPLAGTEVLPIVQGGTTDQVSVANLTAGRAVSMSSLTVTPAADTNAAATIQAASRTTAGQSEARLNLTAVSRETTNTRQATYVLRVDPDSDFGAAALRIDYTYDGVSYGTRFGVNSAGNLFQGAAGKGFDFNANTPLAGMTSQLLNWYEEGTWTPTPTNISGTNTYAGTYTRIGNRVYWEIIINTSSTIVITGASSTLSLPSTSAADSTCAAANRSTGAGYGTGLVTGANAWPPTCNPGASQSIVVSGSYRV